MLPRQVVTRALLLLLTVSVASGDNEGGGMHQGSTVCIEIRPPSSQSPPTRVCGPLAHGGVQRPPSQQDPPQQPPHTEMKAAEPSRPCSHGGLPRYAAPPPMPMMMGQRMMEPMPMVPPVWREAPPYDAQRSQMPPMMVQPPMGGPMGMPINGHMGPMVPSPMAVGRSWFSPSASPEESKPKAAEGVDEKEKKDFQSLLLECEKKTQLLMEKEKEIARLKEMLEKKNSSEQQQKQPTKPPTTKS